jgi:hypothetical protein
LAYGNNAFLKIAFHFLSIRAEHNPGDIIACPSSTKAVNVGDAVPRLRLHFGFGEIARPAAARSGSGLTGSGDPQELLVGFQKLEKVAS